MVQHFFGLSLTSDFLQGLIMVGLKEFVLQNTLGPDDVHFHFSGVSGHPRILIRMTRSPVTAQSR